MLAGEVGVELLAGGAVEFGLGVEEVVACLTETGEETAVGFLGGEAEFAPFFLKGDDRFGGGVPVGE